MSSEVFPPTQRDGNGEEWVSISDLMAGLMMVFLAISIFFMLRVRAEQGELEGIAQIYEQLRVDLYKSLELEFREDLPKWNATIYEDTLSIRFREPDVLFDQGSSALKEQFETILGDFFPRYVSILASPDFRDHITEIRIEGHTSSEWAEEVSPEDSYFLNMELSQARTRSVLEHVYRLPSVSSERVWLKPRFTANGLSSSHLISVDGQEDRESSRRVEFRVRTDAEEQMGRIQERMKSIHGKRGSQ